MLPRLKNGSAIIGLALGLCTFSGAAMAFDLFDKIKSDFAAIHAQGEQERAQIRANSQATNSLASGGQQSIVLAADDHVGNSANEKTEGKEKPKKMLFPNDKRMSVAVDEAIPYIEKVVNIHRCIKDFDSIRFLNIYAVPGVQLVGISNFPNSDAFMKYHDHNKCVSIRTLDEWQMPALNALRFRVVYIADDSGETVNFGYLFKKMDDGSWKIGERLQNVQ